MAQIQESGVGGPRRCPFLVDAIIVKRKASDRFRNLMAKSKSPEMCILRALNNPERPRPLSHTSR